MTRSGTIRVLAGLLLGAIPASSALACATCFGQSDAPMAQGMNAGILFLLGVVALVLGGLVAMIATFAVRTARLGRTREALASADPPGEDLPMAPRRHETGSEGLSVPEGRLTGTPSRPSCRTRQAGRS